MGSYSSATECTLLLVRMIKEGVLQNRLMFYVRKINFLQSRRYSYLPFFTFAELRVQPDITNAIKYMQKIYPCSLANYWSIDPKTDRKLNYVSNINFINYILS